MELHFLKAEDPLTKQFTKEDDGSYTKKPYPMATKVTSMAVTVDSPETFHVALVGAAEIAACLQKGELDGAVNNESRANRTLTDKETEWVVFDLDGLEGISTAEEFIHNVLPTPFHEVSYISQLSCSSGITGSGMRLHLFFLLSTGTAPKMVQSFLTETNLDTPILRSQVKLAAGGMALRFPLDRSVAVNSKLIFIAPPICTNFEDPLAGQRISLHTRANSRVQFDFKGSSTGIIRRKERQLIKELRANQGMEPRKFKITKEGDIEVLHNADTVEVTDWWEAGGFIHMNLDGGDSGAYWLNPKRPRLIQNFKGEPALILKDVALDFFKEIGDHILSTSEILLFRDKTLNKYWAGTYDPNEDRITEGLDPIDKKDMEDWCTYSFGAAVPDPLPQYRLVFNPTKDKVVDRQAGVVNKFEATDYMRMTPPTELPTLGPITERVFRSVTGDDEVMFNYFMNWLAYIFQYRKKTMTAMVLHGCPGTGKGVLFNHILRPIFGKYAVAKQLDKLERDQFDGFLAENLLVQFDEAQANKAMRNRLFNWITEGHTDVRRMYSDAQEVETYCSFIFASNQHDAVKIETLDRRYIVPPRQETPLKLTVDEVERQLPKEVSTFARYLLAWKVDVELATHPIESQAKQDMREASMDTIDQFVEAIKIGDMGYFLEAMVDGRGLRLGTGAEEIIKRWAENVNSGEGSFIPNHEMLTVYKFITQQEPVPFKFGKIMTHRGLPKREEYVDPNTGIPIGKGLLIEWKAPVQLLRRFKTELGGIKAPSLDGLERKILDIGNADNEQ